MSEIPAFTRQFPKEGGDAASTLDFVYRQVPGVEQAARARCAVDDQVHRVAYAPYDAQALLREVGQLFDNTTENDRPTSSDERVKALLGGIAVSTQGETND